MSATYTEILVAVDTSAEAKQVWLKALNMASGPDARLTLIHVVEPLLVESGFELMPVVSIEMEKALVQRSTEFLQGLIADEAQGRQVTSLVRVGSIRQQILGAATEQKADLIVIGTHGRHGIAALLGSTANAVLHGAPCDVLCVRVGKTG